MSGSAPSNGPGVLRSLRTRQNLASMHGCSRVLWLPPSNSRGTIPLAPVSLDSPVLWFILPQDISAGLWPLAPVTRYAPVLTLVSSPTFGLRSKSNTEEHSTRPPPSASLSPLMYNYELVC